ncbi:MAG: hypothetical protein ACQESF_00625, partial [Nanobdellota archaeon]
GYMSECLEMEGRYIFMDLGKTGGRFINDTYNSSYLLNGSDKLVPSLNEVNAKLKKKFNESIKRCITNYVGYENITRLKPDYQFVYTNTGVEISINNPYKVETNENTKYKETIPVRMNVRVKPLLNMINQTLDDFRDEGYIYEDNLLAEEGIQVFIKKIGNERLWVIKDSKSIEYNKPYIFRFVVEK